MAVRKKNSLYLVILIVTNLLTLPCMGGDNINLPHQRQSFTTHPAEDRDPAISPDGKWVLFSSKREGNWDIYLKSSDGGPPIRLTDDLSDEISPAWAPNGKAFTFVSNKNDAQGDIWLMKIKFAGAPRPGKVKKLTLYLGYDGEPVFTPDGEGVCFVSDRSSQYEIWLYDLRQNKASVLTEGGGLSPDIDSSGKLAFIRITPQIPTGEVFIIHDYRIPSNSTQLTFSNMINMSPSFSPDGKVLVVSRITRDTNNDGIVSIDDNQSLWIVPLEPGISIYKTEFQITRKSSSTHRPFWGTDGWIYCTSLTTSGTNDIFRYKQQGCFGRMDQADEQLALAKKYSDQPDNFLLGLESVKGFFFDTPQAATALYLKGEIFAVQGNRRTAISYYRRVMRDFSEITDLSYMAEIGYLQVISNFTAGKFGSIGKVENPAGFVSALEDILNRNPSGKPRAKAKILKGNALFQMGVLSEALETYMQIMEELDDFPDYCAEAQFHTAEIFSCYGDPAEVVQAYLKLIKDYPNQEDWNRLAIERIINLELGEDEFAGFQRIIGKYRKYPRLVATTKLEMAHRLFVQGQIDLALAEYAPLLQFPDDDPLSETIRASSAFETVNIYLERDEFLEAVSILEDLAKTSARYRPDAIKRMFQAYITRGEKLLKENDYELSLAMYNKARQITSEKLQAHRGYILVMNRFERGDHAYREYADSSDAHPDNPIYLYCQGLALSYISEFDPLELKRSSQLIESALALDYRMIPAYLTLSYNYQAIEELTRTGRVKIGILPRIYRSTTEIFREFWRAITFQGDPKEFSGYELAINALTQALAMNDETADPKIEAALLRNIGNNYYSFGEFGFKKAFESYSRMLEFDSSFQDLRSKAVIDERIGRTGMFINEFSKSRQHLKASQDIYTKLGDEGSVFRLLLLRAELEMRVGNSDSSNDLFRAAIQQAEMNNIEIPKALYFSDIAFSWYQNNEWDFALNACQQSLDELSGGKIKRPSYNPYKIGFEILGIDFPISIPIPSFIAGNLALGESRSVEGFRLADIKSLVLSIESSALSEKGEYAQAEKTQLEKLELAKYKRNHEEAAICLNCLAWLSFQQEKYAQTADFLLESIKLCEKPKNELGIYISVANLQILQELLSPDYPHLNQIRRLIENTISKIEIIPPDSPKRLLFISEKVTILGMKGSIVFKEAITLIESSNLDSILLGYSLLEGALSLWETALELQGDNRTSRKTVIIQSNLACASAVLGDWEYSISRLDSLTNTAISEGYLDFIWRLKMLKGEILMMQHRGDIEYAETVFYQSADYLEDFIHNKYQPLPSIYNQKRKLYQRLVDLNIKKGNTAAAFNWVERESGLRVIEIIAQREFEVKGEWRKYIWSQGGGNINFYRNEIARLEAERQRHDLKPQEKAAIIDSLTSIYDEYKSTLEEVQNRDPEFASLFSVCPISVEGIQSMLEDDELMLRFFEFDDVYHVWTIAKDGLFDYRIPLKKDSLNLLISSLTSVVIDTSSYYAVKKLSEILFNPISDKLNNYATLLLVPDGLLKDIAFENLIWNEKALYRDFNITYAPSASFFHYTRSKRIVGGKSILYIGCDHDSLKVDDRFNTMEVSAFSNPENLFKTLSLADITILKSEFKLNSMPSLNASFTVPGDRDLEFEIRLYQSFAYDFPSSLFILDAIDISDNGGWMLLRSLCFGGVAGFIVMNPQAKPEQKRAYYTELFRHLPDNSPLEAHHLALNAISTALTIEPSRVAKYWGDSGMTPEDEIQFAKQNFRNIVFQGNKNLQERDYKWASRYYRQAMEMARRLNDKESQFNLLKLQLKAAYLDGDWDAATSYQYRLYESSVSGRTTGSGEANLAFFFLQKGQIDSAAVHSTSASEIYLSLGASEKAAQTLLNFAQSLEHKGEYIRAESFAEKAGSILREANHSDTLLTDLFRGKLLFEMGLPIDAATVLTPLVESGNLKSSDAAFAHYLLGRSKEGTIDFYSAIDHFQIAFEIAPQDSFKSQGSAIQGMADIHFKLGNYPDALEYIQRARGLFNKAHAAQELFLTYNTEGLVRMNMGQYSEAEKSLLKALELVQATTDRESEASIRKNLTRYYTEQDEIDQALFQARRALEIDIKTERTSESAYDHLALAGLLMLKDDHEGASSQFNRAFSLSQNLNDYRIDLKIALGKAFIELKHKEWLSAEEILQPALDLANRLEISEFQWRVDQLQGMIYAGRGETDLALEKFLRAAGFVEKLLFFRVDWETNTIFLDNHIAPFDYAINILIDAGDIFTAFETAEKAKYLQAKFALFHQGVALRAGRLYAKEELNFRSKIEAFDKKLESLKIHQGDPEIIAQLKKDIEKTLEQYNSLLDHIQSADYEYYNIITDNTFSITDTLQKAKLKQSLYDKTIMLYYYTGLQGIYTWAITADTMVAQQIITTPKQLHRKVISFRRLIEGNLNAQSTARWFYDKLLAPFEALIDKTEGIIIVPDGVLSQIPFDVLTDRNNTYSLERWEISYALNLRNFLHSQNYIGDQSAPIIALADPQYPGVQQMKFARKEVESIAFTVPGTQTYFREEVTFDAVSKAVHTASVLHLACHGLGNRDTPLDYTLLLTPTDDNRKLTARRVYGLESDAKLIFLSSCGENITSSLSSTSLNLTHALRTAGASAVISSFWRVDDLATGILAKRFYRYLIEGDSMSEALRRAKLFVKDEFNPHPAYWAAFQLYGNRGQLARFHSN